MAGLVVLMLAVAIPLGIVVFTVIATESERKTYRHPAVSRSFTSLVFGSAALAGTAIVLVPRAYDSGPMLMLGIPAALIAALLAAAAHRFLIARSKLIAAMSGTVIALLTVLGTSALIAIFFSREIGVAMTIVTFGAVLVLTPKGIPVLFVGALAGVLLSYLSNHKRPNAPTSGAPVS